MNRKPIFIALIASLAISMLLWSKLDKKAPSNVTAPVVTQPTIPKKSVVVCKKRISSRTRLEEAIVLDTLEIKDVIASSVPALAFTSIASLTGRYTAITVLPGDIMTPDRVMSSDQIPNLARAVPRGKRAVSIKVSKETSVSGFIQQGDFVDVIATLRPIGGDSVTKIVLQDIQILAAGSTYEFDGSIATSTPTISASKMALVTLAVSPEELERLIHLESGTRFRLVLKNPSDKDIKVLTSGATQRKLMKSVGIGKVSSSNTSATSVQTRYTEPTDDGRVEIMYGAQVKRQIYKYGGPAANKFNNLQKNIQVYSPPAMSGPDAETTMNSNNSETEE